jgi:hypothetical protein
MLPMLAATALALPRPAPHDASRAAARIGLAVPPQILIGEASRPTTLSRFHGHSIGVMPRDGRH